MIDAPALSHMPDGGPLINSARGALLDTEALISELERGRLFAVLDVFEKENCPQDARLLRLTDNTLLQPHSRTVCGELYDRRHYRRSGAICVR